MIEDVSLIGGQLFINYLQDASNRLYAYNTSGQLLHEIKLPTIGTVGISGRYDNNEAFYMFTSYTYPPTIYRYDVAENKAELFRKSEISFNAEDFISEQVFSLLKTAPKSL